MPIRPIDIRRKEFRNGFRGYDANQVDDFLDTIADEFERTYNENQRMREETNSLRERLQQFEDLEGSIRAALVHAEQAANDLRRSANREAEDVRQSARREADYTIKEAQNRSHQMLADSSARIERVQDSYEALQDAKRSFANDFRHLLKTYMEMMENMEVSSAREIEASLRERLDTESIAVVREAAARNEPAAADLDEPAFGTAGDSADLEDPGSTQRIEPETAAAVEPAAEREAEEPQATGPLANEPSVETPDDDQATQVLRPEEPVSTSPAGDETDGDPSTTWTTEASESDEPDAREPEPSAAGMTEDAEAGEPRASEEVDREEPTLAEESSSHEFFDKDSSDREGGESRISRASRFLRRRE